MKFIKDLIENEINRTGDTTSARLLHVDNPSILFRGNNAAPRIITAFVHDNSGSYLMDTLGGPLNEVIRDPRLQDFSIASTIPAEERDQNLRHIETVAKMFLDAIVDSADAFPSYIYSKLD